MFGEYVPGEICPGGNVRIPSLCGLLIELVSVLTGSYDTSTHTIVFLVLAPFTRDTFLLQQYITPIFLSRLGYVRIQLL